jgi:hypothetical protein
MPLGRRMGRPGLIGVAARTAVVAGTASATAGAVNRHQEQKYAASAEAQAQQDAAAQDEQQRLAMEAAQQVAAQQAAAQPPPAAAPGGDLLGQLQQLGQLHASGVLSDAEFAQAKAKLLA